MEGDGGYVDPGGAYKYGLQVLRNFKTEYRKVPGIAELPDDILKYVAAAGGGAGLDIKNPAINMLNSVYSTPTVANGVLYITARTRLFAIAADVPAK